MNAEGACFGGILSSCPDACNAMITAGVNVLDVTMQGMCTHVDRCTCSCMSMCSKSGSCMCRTVDVENIVQALGRLRPRVSAAANEQLQAALEGSIFRDRGSAVAPPRVSNPIIP